MQAAGVAVSAAAGSAKVAAGGALERVVGRVQDLLPRRKPAYRRVTPLASRRETQRRAALAILALVLVVGGLGLAVYVFGGQGKQVAISSVNAGQKALDTAKANLAAVKAPGVDLVVDDPKQAKELLTEAYQELQAAREANVSAGGHRPAREAGDGRARPPVRRGAGGDDHALHVQARRGRRPDQPDARWSRAPTAPRT